MKNKVGNERAIISSVQKNGGPIGKRWFMHMCSQPGVFVSHSTPDLSPPYLPKRFMTNWHNFFKMISMTEKVQICHQHLSSTVGHRHRYGTSFEMSLTFVPADISKSRIANRYQHQHLSNHHCNDGDSSHSWNIFRLIDIDIDSIWSLKTDRILVPHWSNMDKLLDCEAASVSFTMSKLLSKPSSILEGEKKRYRLKDMIKVLPVWYFWAW